jgi:hypothetical protein
MDAKDVASFLVYFYNINNEEPALIPVSKLARRER